MPYVPSQFLHISTWGHDGCVTCPRDCEFIERRLSFSDILPAMMPRLRHFFLVSITLAYWTYIIVAASPRALSTLTLANTTAPPMHSIQCVHSVDWVTKDFIAGDCYTALASFEDWEVYRYVLEPKILLCTHLSLDRERGNTPWRYCPSPCIVHVLLLPQTHPFSLSYTPQPSLLFSHHQSPPPS